MSSHTSSNISSRKTISSTLENSMRSLSSVVNSNSASDPAIVLIHLLIAALAELLLHLSVSQYLAKQNDEF